MFILDETVYIEALQKNVTVTKVGLHTLEGIDADTGDPIVLTLSSHAYKTLLQAAPEDARITHAVSATDSTRLQFIHPRGDIYSAKWYGKQYQWTINGKQASATAVWKHVYKVGGN